MQVTANGLVIHERVLSNDNRLLTILTAEYGIVRAFVKLVKKLGGTMSASTDLFAYSSFVLFHNKDQYSINSAEANRIFYQRLLPIWGSLQKSLLPKGKRQRNTSNCF